MAGKAKILVIDDQAFVCNIVHDMLCFHGYEVDKALNEEEALHIFKTTLKNNTVYDLIILDLTINGNNLGLEILHKLRVLSKTIKVIATSGHTENEIMENPELYGFNGSLHKPYRMDQLISIVEKAISPVE